MGCSLGVIGGSGIYDFGANVRVTYEVIETPYGPPSDAVARASIDGRELLFLPRHGHGHSKAPHELNNRANIWALKKLGATHLLSLSAVGSMRENIAPGDVVVVDQYVDWTRRRISTFCEDGIVGHVSFAHPVCSLLAESLVAAAERAGAKVHAEGTYLCIEGPQFSTRAESDIYRSFGVSVIGMTALPEAKLAREAELPYATLALVTDYDCWHETEQPVSVAAVVAMLQRNAEVGRRIALGLAATLPDPKRSVAWRALHGALLTRPEAITQSHRDRLFWVFD